MGDPQQPWVPETAPAALKDFISCKSTTLTLTKAKVDWLPLPDLVPDPTMSFGPGAKAGSVTVTLDFGSMLPSVTFDASVQDGGLTADTSGVAGAIPGAQDKLDQWIKDFNAWLKKNGKRLKPAALKGGVLTLTKEGIAATASPPPPPPPPPPSTPPTTPPSTTPSGPGGCPLMLLILILGVAVVVLGSVALTSFLPKPSPGPDGDVGARPTASGTAVAAASAPATTLTPVPVGTPEPVASPTASVVASPAGSPIPSPSVAVSISPVPSFSPPPVGTPPPLIARVLALDLWPPDAGSVADDGTGDGILEQPKQQAGHFPPDLDLTGSAGARLPLSPQALGRLLKSHPCGVPSGETLLVCGQMPFPVGDAVVVTSGLAAPIPMVPTEMLRVYSAAFDSDRSPANDKVATPPNTQDFFTGTDRSYELVWAGSAWQLTRDFARARTAAMGLIQGDVVTLIVPATEFPSGAPAFRSIAYATTDGSFSPRTTGGDVVPGNASPIRLAELWQPSPPGTDAMAFADSLGAAIAKGDTAFLLDRLHPAVFARYGQAQCRTHIKDLPDPTFKIVPSNALAPAPWPWTTDGVTSVFPATTTVMASVTAGSQSVDRELHFAPDDHEFKWFLDCGTPTSP